jgi:membrane associated rhomboid family serine protease
MGYLRGNISFVFLTLMWVTFALQFALLPLVGFGPRSAVWQGVFVLDPGRVEFIWTWVTSIFAHGGFSHIVVNSIVLYFFGPVVERRLGSSRFAALFLVAGVLAGLAQVLSTLVMIGPIGPGVVGASGAIMGIMGVLTMLNPRLRVYLYFIIPVPLWLLTMGFAAFSIVAGFGTAGGGVAHLAHLSGLVIGLAYGIRVRDEVGVPEQLRFGPGGAGRRRF